MRVRWSWCFQMGVLGYLLLPFALAMTPGGGEIEQVWLDDVLAHLEAQLEVCEDEGMRDVIEYTLHRYNRIGPFGVKVMQLPEGIDGWNHPFCPGVTVDSAILLGDTKLGAFVIIHEAMHDYPPWIGHSHIDNDRILRVL